MIAEKGYNPTYGARHLSRTIQKMVEDPLAEEIILGHFTDGSKVRISKKGNDLALKATHSPKKPGAQGSGANRQKRQCPQLRRGDPGEVVGEQVAGRDPVVRKKVVDRDKA